MASRIAPLVFLLASAALAREEKVALDAVPGPVMDAVKARFGAAKVTGAGKETEHGRLVYEISVEEKGRNVDVTVTPAGSVLLIERAIDAGTLPAPVVQTLARKYPGASYRLAEEIVEVEKGKDRLAWYEVLLATSDGHKKEVKVRPDGGSVTEEEDEEDGGEDD